MDSKDAMSRHLQSYLHRGQLYFQLVCGLTLVCGGIALKIFCYRYGVSDIVFKSILLASFVIVFSLVLFQAYLHHRYISGGVSPVTWLTRELRSTLSVLQASELKEENIQNLERDLEVVTKLLINKQAPHRELQVLVETLEQIVVLLKNYWKVQIRNEVLETVNHLAKQVVHDMRGPLSSIKTVTENFSTLRTDNARYEEAANLLALSISRLNEIAEGLLKKPDGKEDSKKEIFSLHKVMDELIGEYQPQHNQRVVFCKQYSDQVIHLYGDRIKLKRAFGNIVKNAVEAMIGGGKICIRCNSNLHSAHISIEDNGPGMCEEKLKHVLEGNFTEGKKGGHGIGLTVVNDTVREFDGRYWAESKPGQGTQFYFQLPLPGEELLRKAPREEMAMEVFVVQIHEDQSIVVIDDDPSIRGQWKFLLKPLLKNLVLCESFEDFARLGLSKKNSNTVIIDYHFENSKINGMEIVNTLRTAGFKNLYLCTAEYWKPSLKKQAEELGVAICPKPLPKISVCHSEPQAKNPKAIGMASSPSETHHDKPGGYTVLVIDDDETIRLA